jgi:hypothetical protein
MSSLYFNTALFFKTYIIRAMKNFILWLKNIPKKFLGWVKGRLAKNPHRSFRRTRPYASRQDFVSAVKGCWSLVFQTSLFIWSHKRIILGLGLIYALLGAFLVGSLSQVDYTAFKDASQKVIGGNVGALSTAFTLFGASISGAFNTPTTPLQQFLSGVLAIFFWLSLVWAARMLTAQKVIKLRDALYNSGSPIVPTLAIMGVMCLQLIPASLGIFAYAIASNGQWLQGGVEAMVFAGAAVLLVLLSLYWLTSSFIGLVVVTLPGMYPLRALSTARDLVLNRRWSIVARIIFLGVVLLIAWAVVMLPIFMIDNWLHFGWLPLIPVFMQIMAGLTVLFVSIYIYKLYRSLL